MAACHGGLSMQYRSVYAQIPQLVWNLRTLNEVQGNGRRQASIEYTLSVSSHSSVRKLFSRSYAAKKLSRIIAAKHLIFIIQKWYNIQ